MVDIRREWISGEFSDFHGQFLISSPNLGVSVTPSCHIGIMFSTMVDDITHQVLNDHTQADWYYTVIHNGQHTADGHQTSYSILGTQYSVLSTWGE